jgi:hypothetical protein
MIKIYENSTYDLTYIVGTRLHVAHIKVKAQKKFTLLTKSLNNNVYCIDKKCYFWFDNLIIIGCPNFINHNIIEHIITWYNKATEYTLCIMLILNLFIKLISVIFAYHGEYLTVMQSTSCLWLGGMTDWGKQMLQKSLSLS